MISKSKAIVLHQVKYSETSVIATLYTEEFGRQSYIVNGIRSPKSKQKSGLLQPLFLLEIDAYHKTGREVQRLKEFRLNNIYQNIPFDVVKSTMSMFLSEVMYKVIRNVEADAEMFSFIYNSLLYFDTMKEGTANFHLWFLINLLGYLGVQPENNYSPIEKWFDQKNGRFVTFRPSFPNTPDMEESKIISQLIGLKYDDLDTFQLNGNLRFRLLEIIIEYYVIHFESIGEIRSLKVLNEIFH